MTEPRPEEQYTTSTHPGAEWVDGGTWQAKWVPDANAPGLTLAQRVTQLEDVLQAIVKRLAMLEWQMEAIDGESSTPEV